MALKYPELFKPYNIGKLRIKNRVAMAPMHLGGRNDDTGNMTEEVIDYYEARAKGGFGLIITGGYACAGGAEITTAALNAMDNPADPRYTLSFDLLFRGMEVTTGGQRIHDYQAQVNKMLAKGMHPEEFESYLMIHKHGMPPHGGLGIGLERLTARLCGLENIRETCLFPRDLSRLEP